MPRSLPALGLVVVLALLGPARRAGAELYRWTDAEGRIHYTQDLQSVPAGKRAEARRSRQGGEAGSLQRYSAPERPARAERARPGAAHRVTFERRGNMMVVEVRLNDRLSAPFYVDTGASDVLIPAALADRLGIGVGPRTPRRVYRTANGPVSKPVVTLDAVELGSARVEDVEAAVSGTMRVGLLGGAFFNHFEVGIDPAEQVLTLQRSEGMRGGRAEAEWRRTFERLRGGLERLGRRLEAGRRLPEPRRAALEERREELRAELERLRRAADRADVPHRWRR